MPRSLTPVEPKKLEHIKTLVEIQKPKGGNFFSTKRYNSLQELEVGLRRFQSHLQQVCSVYIAFIENFSNVNSGDFENMAGMTREAFQQQIELHRTLELDVLDISRELLTLLEQENEKPRIPESGTNLEYLNRETSVENTF